MFERGAFAAIISLLSLCGSLLAQDRQEVPQYRARVRLAEVTVQAKGADGRHVTDLEAGELTLRAGSRLREIRFFRPVRVGLERFGELKPVGVEYHQPFVESLYQPRYYLLLFHQIQFRFGAFQRARAAAIEFVRSRMLPNDHVAVVAFDKRLDFELDFTSDRGLVLEALEGMYLRHRNIQWYDHFYAYLQELAARLARMEHKVTIILIADGMLGIGGPAAFRVYDNTIQALQAADVRVYGVDAGGLNLRDPGARVARFSPQVAALIRQSFNLGLYTQPTGGRLYRYHNNLLALLEQVDYEMSAYYVLGFYLDEDEELDGPISISISCSRPEVELRYKGRLRYRHETEEMFDTQPR